MWLKSGAGSYTQILLIHIMCINIANGICSMILGLHVLTRCKVTNKIGATLGGLNANPIDYLEACGESKDLFRDNRIVLC